jgi:PAS domain S-box-containing protein
MLTITGPGAPDGPPASTRTHKGPLHPAASLAAYAMNTASPVVVGDLADEKRFTDLFLRKLSVASALCVPLHLGSQAFGALGVYGKTPRQFTAVDVRFAETIAHLLASSLGRLRLEEDLRQQRALAAAVLLAVDSPVLTLDADGLVLDMNPPCQHLTGRTPTDARGKAFWSLFAVPEEVDLVERILRTSLRERNACEFEAALLTRHGTRGQVGWSLRAMEEGEGQSPAAVLVGTVRAEPALDASTPLPRNPAGQDTRAEAGAPPFQPLGAKVDKDLRASLRRSYEYRQRISPLSGQRIPAHEEFFEVECRDISAGGISFFMDAPPGFENLVVALGRPPVQSHFTARVMRVVPTIKEGRQVHLVGCRFTGRVLSGK